MTYTSLAFFMVLYAVLYLRDMTGRTYVLNQGTEEKVKEIIKGYLRTSVIDKAEEKGKKSIELNVNKYNDAVMIYEKLGFSVSI